MKLMTFLLFLLLTVTLFLNVVPVKGASTTLYDVFALKEYKQWSSYSPQYTFSKSSSSILQVISTDAGFGDAYVYMPIDRDYLNGKKLRIYWHWYLDWSGTSYTLAQLYVVDHEHNRKLDNSVEFRTQGDIEHPISDYTNTLACSYTATCNGGWVDWTTDTSSVLNLNGFSSAIVSIIIKTYDPWIADTTGLQVDYLQVLDSSNNVLNEYHFTGSVFMEETGGYYDYGLIRKPSCVLWGTTDYPEDSFPPGYDNNDELWLSEQVSDYIYDLFYSTGKYPYLQDYWGDNTEPNTVYSNVEYCEEYYDYSVFFYKGHFWQTQSGGVCGVPGCSYLHRGVVDDEGYGVDPVEAIKDYLLYDNVDDGKSAAHKTRGTHDFVFLWACMHGDPNWVGDITDHGCGVAASLMDIDDVDSTLSWDGYYDPDYTDHVFISFDYISPWYIQAAQQYPYNYGHFIYQFFYYTLTSGYSISLALYAASYDVNGCSYYLSDLRNGESVWNPQAEVWNTTCMKVYGDGDYRLPR